MEEQVNGISFKFVKRIGVLAEYKNGWRKELNIISWNGGKPKYDIRDWAPNYGHMSRGATLSEAEMNNLLLHMREFKQQQKGKEKVSEPQEKDYER